MNNKIKKLIDYIKKEFPDGCGHDYGCPSSCPLKKCGKATLENDVCNMLANQEYRTRD